MTRLTSIHRPQSWRQRVADAWLILSGQTTLHRTYQDGYDDHIIQDSRRRSFALTPRSILVTVEGLTGTGKSAVYGEIEIALRAIGLDVRHVDQKSADVEKNMTHADWQSELEFYKPTIVLSEVNIPRSPR